MIWWLFLALLLIVKYKVDQQIVIMLSFLSLSQFNKGSVSKGSELQIEVAEFLWRNVQVKHSD